MVSPPSAPPLPSITGTPPPAPLFGAQTKPGAKPGVKPNQPTVLGSQMTSNPTNTGQKTLLGS